MISRIDVEFILEKYFYIIYDKMHNFLFGVSIFERALKDTLYWYLLTVYLLYFKVN